MKTQRNIIALLLPLLLISFTACQKSSPEEDKLPKDSSNSPSTEEYMIDAHPPENTLALTFERQHQPIPILDLHVDLYTMQADGTFSKIYYPECNSHGYNKKPRYNLVGFSFPWPENFTPEQTGRLYISINGGKKNLLEMAYNPRFHNPVRSSIHLNGETTIWGDKGQREPIPLQLAADGTLTYEIEEPCAE